MPSRYKTHTQDVGPVAANAAGQFNLVLNNTPDNINIFKIDIVPSLLGGTAQYQIFDEDTFAAARLVYDTLATAGEYHDPVLVDDNDAVTVQGSLVMFLLPYYDRGEDGQIHLKITNNDAQQKNFNVKIVYEVVTVS